jgi:hypothetical protein
VSISWLCVDPAGARCIWRVGACQPAVAVVQSTVNMSTLLFLQVVVPPTHRQGKGEVLVRCGKCHR